MTFFCERFKFCFGVQRGFVEMRKYDTFNSLRRAPLHIQFQTRSTLTQHMLMTTFEMKYLVYQITAFNSLRRRNSCIEPPEMHLNFIIITLCILCLLHNTIKLNSQAFSCIWWQLELFDQGTDCLLSRGIAG